MDCNDELKEINIKTSKCYYFGEVNKIGQFNLNNILMKNCTKMF